MLLREDLKLVADPDVPPGYIRPKAVALDGNVMIPIKPIWFLATGWANPDHLLRYRSDEQKLSFRGGENVWDLTDVHCLLALTARTGWFKTPVTEFQILVGQFRPFERHCVFSTTISDPVRAFRDLIEPFAKAMNKPGCFVKLEPDGTFAVTKLNELPS